MESAANFINGKLLAVDVFGQKYDVVLNTDFYERRNQLAIFGCLPNGEPFGTLTVCIPHINLHTNEILVKTWSENEPFAKAALASGLFVDTGKRVHNGFVVAPIWTINVL
jgi:hypothetical protein